MDLPLWITRHGPIFVGDGNVRMALRWAAAEPGAVQVPILDIDRARNWQEFTAAIRRFPARAQLRLCGRGRKHRLPRRGMLPCAATIAATCRWTAPPATTSGTASFPSSSCLRHSTRRGGLIVTANQNPFPPDYPYNVNGNFAPYYRSKQILDRLLARPKWTPEDLLSVQADVYSAFSKFLGGRWWRHPEAQAHNPPSRAVELLGAGTGRWTRTWRRRGGGARLPAPARRRGRDRRAGQGAYEYDLRQPPGDRTDAARASDGWFRDYDETLLRVLVDAVEEGQRMQGRDVKKWRYGIPEGDRSPIR